MAPTIVAPYGSWRSPVTAASLTQESVSLGEPTVDGSDLYWLEGRPGDAGRVVLVRRTPDGQTRDVTAAPFNVRSRVHEYGGGSYDVADGVVVFCNYDDRRVYRLDVGGVDAGTAPVPITPAGPLRYGDLRIDLARQVVHAVCEDHSDGATQAVNRLVGLSLEGDNLDGGTVLVQGHDFFSSAVVSPDGSQLAWLQWDHPNMPWDGTELVVGELGGDGLVSGARRVAGGRDESVTQPRWLRPGLLVFVSDTTGWWNLYTCSVRGAPGEPQAMYPTAQEFAGPQWLLRTSSYGIGARGTLLCAVTVDGYARLTVLDGHTGRISDIDSDLTAVGAMSVQGDTALLTIGYADRPAALVRIDLLSRAGIQVVRQATTSTLEPGLVSEPEAVTWAGAQGEDVFGFYFGPRNPGYAAPEGELPPLIVMSHGGPTSMTEPVFTPGVQYWTTRGFAVLQVNYGGSSGYGRAYRERLRGQWGVVDVDDCASGALAMAALGKADPDRLAIRGGSAGGYTTLAALTFRDVFHAGASLFGIGDLETLARDTHKFESRYGDGLIGPYPEARDRYRERSPVHHVDRLSCPLILLQGADDLVVPADQARDMAAAVRAKGLPVALLIFPGEGHGFRKAETVVRAFEAEAYFYSRVFGFELGDPVPPVDIENL